jgi:hypothetical protein
VFVTNLLSNIHLLNIKLAIWLVAHYMFRNFRGDSNTIGSVVSQATYEMVWRSFVK